MYNQLLEIGIVFFFSKKKLLYPLRHKCVTAKNVNPYISIFDILQVYLRKEPDLISSSSSYRSTRQVFFLYPIHAVEITVIVIQRWEFPQYVSVCERPLFLSSVNAQYIPDGQKTPLTERCFSYLCTSRFLIGSVTLSLCSGTSLRWFALISFWTRT